GSRQPPLAHHLANPVDEIRGELALGQFVANFFGLRRLENVVQIGQQGSQRQSHDSNPLPSKKAAKEISGALRAVPCTIFAKNEKLKELDGGGPDDLGPPFCEGAQFRV